MGRLTAGKLNHRAVTNNTEWDLAATQVHFAVVIAIAWETRQLKCEELQQHSCRLNQHRIS